MLTLNAQCHPQVMAKFGVDEHAFALEAEVTLIDLAQCIDGLKAQHGRAPISIHIAFGTDGAKAIRPVGRNRQTH